MKAEFNKATEQKFSHIELENDFIKNCFRDEFNKAKVKPNKKKTSVNSEEKVTFED